MDSFGPDDVVRVVRVTLIKPPPRGDAGDAKPSRAEQNNAGGGDGGGGDYRLNPRTNDALVGKGAGASHGVNEMPKTNTNQNAVVEVALATCSQLMRGKVKDLPSTEKRTVDFGGEIGEQTDLDVTSLRTPHARHRSDLCA